MGLFLEPRLQTLVRIHFSFSCRKSEGFVMIYQSVHILRRPWLNPLLYQECTKTSLCRFEFKDESFEIPFKDVQSYDMKSTSKEIAIRIAIALFCYEQRYENKFFLS